MEIVGMLLLALLLAGQYQTGYNEGQAAAVKQPVRIILENGNQHVAVDNTTETVTIYRVED